MYEEHGVVIEKVLYQRTPVVKILPLPRPRTKIIHFSHYIYDRTTYKAIFVPTLSV